MKISKYYHVAALHIWCSASDILYEFGPEEAYLWALAKAGYHSGWLQVEEEKMKSASDSTTVNTEECELCERSSSNVPGHRLTEWNEIQICDDCRAHQIPDRSDEAHIPIIYVAHPFGGDRRNLSKAEEWAAFLSAHFNALFIVPWAPLCRYWPNSGASLRRGLALDVVAVRSCDGLIAVGGEMSPGMRREWDAAIDGQSSKISHICDMTRFSSPEDIADDSDAMAYLAELYGKEQQ